MLVCREYKVKLDLLGIQREQHTYFTLEFEMHPIFMDKTIKKNMF